MKEELVFNENFKYKRLTSKISGYSTAFNCESLGIPYLESIKSMLGFCDEVVVVDGISNDGTYEKLEALSKENCKLKLHQIPFDMTEPGIDGMMKSYARALCENEYLWQQDLDEIVHESDYEKIKLMTKRFPKEDIVHLPVVELWADPYHATGRRHCWKWRISRNKPEITHAINKDARVTHEKTGKVYAKKGMSDGCEYVNSMTYEMLPHFGFYNQQIELARLHMKDHYAEGIQEIFEKLPSVWHTSWMDIPRKLEQLKPGGQWDKLWSLLYQEEAQNRFSDVDFNNPEQVKALVDKLSEQGGEDSDNVKYKFKVNKQPPKLLLEWLEKKKSAK